MTEILYRSNRLEVRRVAAGDGRRQVITFDSYHEPPGVDRPGFGEAFFKTEGVTAIHVMSHGNDWFQYTEMEHVLSVIREAANPAKQLMTYGSSMGGYAALRFAKAVGANSALALSPQYSVNRRRAPFETRWASDRRRIRFIKALERPLQPVPLMVLAYDSRIDLDSRHNVRLCGEADIEQIPLPFAGHPVGAFLNDIKLLRPLVLTILDGTFDRQDFHTLARARARKSAHWLANVAERYPNARAAVPLARRAVSLAPDHPSLHHLLAQRLADAGRYDEAIESHRQAISLEPIVDYKWGLSKTLHKAGYLRGALEVAIEIQQLAPSAAGYHAWAARLREELKDYSGAFVNWRAASRNDPRNPAYRVAVMRLAWRAGLTLLGKNMS